MNDYFSEYKTFMTEPREFLPFKQGTGHLQRCIAEFIKLKLEHQQNNNLQAFCTYIQPDEEKFINDELLFMIPSSIDESNAQLSFDLEKFSKSINRSSSYVTDMLRSLVTISIEIADEDGKNLSSSSYIFSNLDIDYPTDRETGKKNENLYIHLRMDKEFYKVCVDQDLKAKIAMERIMKWVW